ADHDCLDEACGRYAPLPSSRQCAPSRGRFPMCYGPEFISRALDHWAYINRVTPDFSRPGKPTYTDVVEKSFQPGAGIFFERELARSGQSGHTDWARSGLGC
ncbi:hypothetical protein ACFOOJ_13000, partial [Sphingobium xenophagum]